MCVAWEAEGESSFSVKRQPEEGAAVRRTSPIWISMVLGKAEILRQKEEGSLEGGRVGGREGGRRMCERQTYNFSDTYSSFPYLPPSFPPSFPPYLIFAFFNASLNSGLNANQPISLQACGT